MCCNIMITIKNCAPTTLLAVTRDERQRRLRLRALDFPALLACRGSLGEIG